MTFRNANARCPRLLTALASLAAVLASLVTAEVHAQRLSLDRLKSGSEVLKAFRPVVAEPNRSTVRVRADDEDLALGAIVDADGYVLTKASQLPDDEPIVCRLYDGRTPRAEIVGVHDDFDLAMLKIDATDLPVTLWSEADAVIGQWLATPGLQETPVGVGVVSVRPREIPSERGVLGISLADEEPGPTITQVFPDTGAAKAGLKAGDVIARVQGKAIEDAAAVASSIARLRPGDTLNLLVVRGDEQVGVRATLGALSAEVPGMLNRKEFQNRLGGELSLRRGGFPLVLQHDTILRPEDCGGPIVGLDGRAVGINIARAGRTETYAIPTAEILPLLNDLKSGETIPPLSLVPSP